MGKQTIKKKKKSMVKNKSFGTKITIERGIDQRLQTLDGKNCIFNNVQMCSTVNPFLLTTFAFWLIEDYRGATQEDPIYIWDTY